MQLIVTPFDGAGTSIFNGERSHSSGARVEGYQLAGLPFTSIDV
jgi:hypothetical protein